MFKKTLIAAAVVATTATFGAAASTVTTASTPTVGVEYAQGIGQIVAADVVVTPARDYDSGDIITVSFAGATVATHTAAATPVAIVPTITGAGNLASNIEFLEYDGNDVKMLVTNPVSFAAGTTVTVSGVQLITTEASDKGLVKVSAVGKVATVEGAKIVDASTAVTYITYATELKGAFSTKFDAVVDVNAARKEFVGGGTTDTLVLSNTVASVAAGMGVTTTGATYTVKGDFSFLDENGDGDIADAKDGSITSAAGTVALAADMMSVTVKSGSALSTGTVGISVNGPTGVVIPDQSFTASTMVSYTNPKGGATDLVSTTLADSAAGSWTLNGAKAHVPLMYVGTNYAQAVTISNTSTQTGGVDIVVYIGDDTVEFEGVATAAGEGVTDISAAVRQAIADGGITSGVASFDVIVNAPTTAITVNALYYTKSDGDRVLTK
jgi:hypothetical protein